MDGLAASLYKKIPVNMRILAETAFGSSKPITEKDFTTEDLNFIKQLYEQKRKQNNEVENILKNKLKKHKDTTEGLQYITNSKGDLVDNTLNYLNNLRKKANSFDNTRNKTSINSYADYTDDVYEDSGMGKQILSSFSDPSYRVKTTLGRFNIIKDDNGNHRVKDTYNWTKYNPKGTINALPRFNAEHIGNAFMRLVRPDASREVDINLGKLD